MVKKLIFLLLSVVLLTVTVYAESAIYPTNIEQKNEGGAQLILKTYEVPPDISPDDLVEPNLTQNGVEYELRDILRESNPDQVISNTVSQSVTVESVPDKPEDILKLLKPNIKYDESGFTGELTLDESSIRTETVGESPYSYTVTDTREYPGLISNDPYLIPKTVQKNGVTLSLCDIRWIGGDENEPDPVYSAAATYRGSASGSKPGGYTATATYSGEVAKTTPGSVIYTLVYAAVPAPEITPVSPDWTALWIYPAIVLIIGAVGTGIYFAFFKRKRGLPAAESESVVVSRKIHIPMALSHQEIEEDSDEQN